MCFGCEARAIYDLLSELCGNLLDGSILCLGDNEPHIDDEEKLQYDENDENIWADRHLQ